MADTSRLTIPEEAVKAAFGSEFGDTVTTKQVKSVLEAAAPLIVAAYLEQIASDTNCLDDHQLLVDYAAELRGGETRG